MRIAVALCGVILAGASGTFAIDVTQCGQRVPDRDTGILQADLTCPPAGFCQASTGGPISMDACVSDQDCPSPSTMHCQQFAVLLGRGATLNLNGHMLAGTGPSAGTNPGVLCETPDGSARCRVTGPGTISDFYAGILPVTGTLTVDHLTLTGNQYGVSGFGAAETVRVFADTITATGNAYGIFAVRIKGQNIDVSGNSEIGLYAPEKARIVGLTANGNGEVGVLTGTRGKFTGVTATGNGGPGIAVSDDAVLRSSTITGNNGAGAGYDILAVSLRARNNMCGKSATLILDCPELFECTYGAGATLGLCGGD